MYNNMMASINIFVCRAYIVLGECQEVLSKYMYCKPTPSFVSATKRKALEHMDESIEVDVGMLPKLVNALNDAGHETSYEVMDADEVGPRPPPTATCATKFARPFLSAPNWK